MDEPAEPDALSNSVSGMDAVKIDKFRQDVHRNILAGRITRARRCGEEISLIDVVDGMQSNSTENPKLTSAAGNMPIQLCKQLNISLAFPNLNPSSDILEERTATFIREKLLEKRCLLFQPDASSKSQQCFFCQKPKEAHGSKHEWPGQYIYEPARVFGTLVFPGRFAKTASFVRFAFDGSRETRDAANSALKLLCGYWKAPKPKLVLSVIGGYQDIRMSKEMQRRIVHESIMNVIDSTNGWLITTGNNSGIAGVIAKGVAERQAIRLKNGERGQIVCIGVAPWRNIENRDEIEKFALQSDKTIPMVVYGKTEVRAHIGQQTRKANELKVCQSVLNANHTHFLFVDNGAQREHAEPAAIEFRAELEKVLADDGAAVITVLIEGGPTTVEQAFASIERGTPVIVLSGSGKVANLIRKLRNYANNYQKESFEEEIQHHFFRRRSTLREAERKWLDESVQKFWTICKSEKVVLVDANSRKEFDIAILQQLVAKETMSGLALAVQWNNIDIAREIVEQCDFEIEEHHTALTTSIIENKVEFVRLLVECGVEMSKFLNWTTLDTLYRETEPYIGRELKRLCKIKKNKADNETSALELSTIDRILVTLTNCPSQYSDDKTGQSIDKFDDPFHDLMIYAVFFSRKEMGCYFWEQTDRPLLSALVALWLAHRLRKRFQERFNETMVDSYEQIERVFEEKAIGLLDTAQRHCPEWASDLVNSRGRPQWPHVTLIEIAAAGGAQLFLGHSVCQREIFQKWSRGYECNRTKYLLSFFLVVPMLFDFFVRFDKENIASKWHTKVPIKYDRESGGSYGNPMYGRYPRYATSRASSDKAMSTTSSSVGYNEMRRLNMDVQEDDLLWYKKIRIFYTSACSKFTLHSVFYVFYLVFYSFVLLFEYKKNNISTCELLLYGWQLSFYLEMWNTLYSTNGKDLPTRFWGWITTGSYGNWNNLDFVHFIIFISALVMRFLSLTFAAAFPVARLGMIVDLLIGYLRLFKIIFIMWYFGPKVIMILKMTQELLMFFMFFAVFMFAYSVSSHCLIYVNLTPHFGIIWDLFRHGLWEIFGEPNEERMLGTVDGCANYSDLQWFSTPDAFDCFVRQHTLPILLTVYLFVTSVLLMNMLIAVFTHIFDAINEHSIQLWRYQMYFLVNEYDVKFFLPAPLIIFYHIFLAARKLHQVVAIKDNVSRKKTKIDPTLINFERICLSEYLESVEKQKEEDIIEKIASKIDDLNKWLYDHWPAKTDSGVRMLSAAPYGLFETASYGSAYADTDSEDVDNFVFDYQQDDSAQSVQ